MRGEVDHMMFLRMLGCAMALTALTGVSSGPVPAAQALPEEKAVIARLQAFLDGIAKRDKAVLTEQLLPGGSATLMRDGKPLQMGFDALVERLSTPGTDTREERIYEPLVRIDNDIAMIWARYEALRNGKVDHCGTDIVNLVKVGDHWLISSIGDTSRTVCKSSTDH
jgi:hypothetical protein